MTHQISYRAYLTVATVAATFLLNPSAGSAQPQPEVKARIAAGMDEAVKALDKYPKTKKLSPEKKRELVEFVLGNTLFVLAHEMGHALMYEMDMPVLGREEDAADSFALVTALKIKSEVSERILLEAAKGYVLTSRRDKKEGAALAFYDEHGLDLQRAYNVVCMMVGSDPEKYKQLAVDTKLPEERQKSCVRDYKTTSWSWEQMLKPHLRTADKPKVNITITYGDTEDYAAQKKILQDMGLMEILGAHMADRYVWPNPFKIQTKECGDPNAAWNIGEKTLTLCYELAGEFIELYQKYNKELPRKLQQQGKPAKNKQAKKR